jgi:5-(carboxyamino)imidazole ribonucleotide synthase
VKFDRNDLPVGTPVVGMVGGGQLARMTQESAVALGIQLRVLAEGPTVSAAQAVADAPVGDYRDPDSVRRFAADCDVVTFDHEHVPGDHIRALERDGVVVHPDADALVHAQDKLVMRQRLDALGIPVPVYAPVRDKSDVTRFADENGWPVVLKAVRGGYDGRGVWLLPELPDELPHTDLYVEQRVPIVHELAVQVARRPNGEMRSWPVVETVQRDGICHEVVAPAPRLSPGFASDAERIATTLADALGVVGLLTVELFEAPGGLLVNELAMRPHNSGHWSIEGATTSQFEQHLRAILDWPLGDTTPRTPFAVMVNLLGGAATDLAQTLPRTLGEVPEASVHLYGKRPRPGRKLGHVTVLGTDVVETRERARRAVELLRGDA